jgi:uncharacterized membrane protein
VAVFGVATHWPDHARVRDVADVTQFAAPGVTFPDAVVVTNLPPCGATPDPADGTLPPAGDGGPQDADCGQLVVRLAGSGQDRRVKVPVPPEVTDSGLVPGDRVELMRTPPAEGQPAGYSYWSTERKAPIGWLALAFVILVVAVARLRGLMAIVGLAVGSVVIFRFMLPALLIGEPAVWVTLSGAAVIMYVVLYTTHGLSVRTSAALAGTLVGITLTAAIGSYAVSSSRLTGVADESGGILSSFVGDLDFQQLLLCGVIVAGLGVLNDVTITQASAVWELRAAAPHRSRGAVFAGAMRIGRDHIASTIYTIMFVYAGSALVVLLLLTLYDRPLLDLVSSEDISEEIVRTLASGIGLVLAVPFTTGIAALVASPAGSDTGIGPRHGRRRRPPRDAFEEFWASG